MNIVRPALDFDSHADIALIRKLAANGRRPNLLIVCPGHAEAIARQVMTIGEAPFRSCTLPGKLVLPADKKGTLLLHDVAALGRTQQIALHDWLGSGRGDLQVISLTDTPLESLVEEGRFMEALYYRLNVVRVTC